MKTSPAVLALMSFLAVRDLFGQGEVEISGELKQWHRVTLTFTGPEADEKAEPNPFLDYRLQVTFQRGQDFYSVPGFFAADGNAAETSATGGDKWRVHFCPPMTGEWAYRVSFRQGKEVSVSDLAAAGSPIAGLDGQTGEFEIMPSDKTGRDNRAKGRLQYVGKRYLKSAGNGEYFLKQGADAPENFLAYADFDGEFKADGHKDGLVKTWGPHIRDWEPGQPTWQDGKGKGIIGAVSYLASEGMNAISFLTFNVGGDDRNVFPYITYDERYRMDVSRLDQWEIVFDHMDRKGMYLHFKTQETENELLLDGGNLGVARKLYYRELIARFSHHLALNWNLGEEINNATTAQKKAWAQYFWRHDPYRNHIVIHNGANHFDLLGDASYLTGFSLQTNRPDFSNVHRRVLEYVQRSTEAGKPWVVACDEPGDASHALVPDKDDPGHDNARKNALWGTLMAGGAGNEWYFGYKHAHSDLTCQDWRSRDEWWDQCRIALEFFRGHVPFWELEPSDELTTAGNDYCLADPGKFYVVYLQNGGSTSVGLGSGRYNIAWYNPRAGGDLHNGTIREVEGPAVATIGLPPTDTDTDWVALVKLVEGDGSDVKVPVKQAPRNDIPIRVRDKGDRQGKVTGFTLIDADTNTPIPGFDPIPEGTVLNLAKLPSRISIRANVSSRLAGGVTFGLNGNENYRVERSAPYSLAGDQNGNYAAWDATQGKHTITAKCASNVVTLKLELVAE